MKKGDIIIAVVWLFHMLSFGVPLTGIVIGFAIGSLLSLWALIDILRAKMKAGNKIFWAAISILFSGTGATLYYFLEVRKRKTE